ncbi:MAG: porin family protein [Bacteroidota bacterium]
MKKILLVSLVMLLAVSVAFSQFGIKGGINLATVGGADKKQNDIDPTNRLCFVGGISCRIGLIAGISIQPEVMYIQKGAVYEVSQTIGGYTGTGKLTFKGDYIDIPLLLKFNLPIPVFSPYIEGGVSYGILLSAKQKEEQSSNYPGDVSTSNETDIKDQMTKNDISWIVGVGFDLSILEIDARYVVGMKRLRKDIPETTTIDENATMIYNRGIILTVGLRF